MANISDIHSVAYRIANSYVVGVNYSFMDAVKDVVCVLYRVGVLGVKLCAAETTNYTYNSSKSLEPSDITENSKCYVHLMFRAALKIALKEHQV